MSLVAARAILACIARPSKQNRFSTRGFVRDEPIISVSGLRGIVGDSLTPEVAIRYVCAFEQSLPPGRPVLISRDGRDTGRMLSQAVASGLEAVGRDTIDAGVAATPTTGVLVRSLLAAGGVQISASHNPAEYNGLKLFSAAGRVIPAAEGRAGTSTSIALAEFDWARHDQIGHAIACVDSVSTHCCAGSSDCRRRAHQASTIPRAA